MGAADQPPISPDQARSAPSRRKPTSSHQRSGPKIKRLLNLGTKPGIAFPDTEDPKWKQLVAEWEQLDLDPHGLYIHLATAQQQRSIENGLHRSRDESDPRIVPGQSVQVDVKHLKTQSGRLYQFGCCRSLTRGCGARSVPGGGYSKLLAVKQPRDHRRP
jgi:hypothetical protein